MLKAPLTTNMGHATIASGGAMNGVNNGGIECPRDCNAKQHDTEICELLQGVNRQDALSYGVVTQHAYH